MVAFLFKLEEGGCSFRYLLNTLTFLQIHNFEADLAVPKLVENEGRPDTFHAVFICAPAVVEVVPDVEVLADYPVPLDKLTSLNPVVGGQEV